MIGEGRPKTENYKHIYKCKECACPCVIKVYASINDHNTVVSPTICPLGSRTAKWVYKSTEAKSAKSK